METGFKIKANFYKRVIASLIDYSLFLFSTYLYVILAGHENEDGGKIVSGLLFLPIPIAWVVYFIVIESFFNATLGHQLFYLKVIGVDRNEIDFLQVLKRHLLDFIDFLPYGIPAIIAIKYSDRHQRLGDMCARTIVVDTKDTEQYLEKTNLL